MPAASFPRCLNETSDGENSLSFSPKMRWRTAPTFSISDSFTAIGWPRSPGTIRNRLFRDYMADAQKRFTHDQEFPEEPKQVQPGRDTSRNDRWPGSGLRPSGRDGWLTENLLNTLMSKNPSLSFALEESFPVQVHLSRRRPARPHHGTPGAGRDRTTFTADAAAQALDYWRTTTQQLPIGSDTSQDQAVLREYSKLAGHASRVACGP